MSRGSPQAHFRNWVDGVQRNVVDHNKQAADAVITYMNHVSLLEDARQDQHPDFDNGIGFIPEQTA